MTDDGDETVPERPTSVEQYIFWLKETGIELTDRHANQFNATTALAADQLSKLPFWTELLSSLSEWDDAYKLRRRVPLLMPPTPEIVTKSYGSFVIKTLRKNVLENDDWPLPPEGGWIIPPTWISQVNDAVRTLLLVKYLDGVRVLADHIVDLARRHDLTCEPSYEATTEGYYAVHITLLPEFEVPSLEFDLESRVIPVELQISTQLQESIRKLLHRYYVDRRTRLPGDDPWQWDYETDEFSANYLGHILHYLEGKIVEIRDKETGLA